MSSVDVPSGVARVRPLARRASRWAPRATRTTSCPLAASRPPMVPPIAPAPMTMYRITPILSGAGATGSAAVRVRGHDGAAGHRQVQVGALGAVLVDERRLEHGARLRVLEGPVLDSGCGGGPADLHDRPAEVVPGVAIDSHPPDVAASSLYSHGQRAVPQPPVPLAASMQRLLVDVLGRVRVG